MAAFPPARRWALPLMLAVALTNRHAGAAAAASASAAAAAGQAPHPFQTKDAHDGFGRNHHLHRRSHHRRLRSSPGPASENDHRLLPRSGRNSGRVLSNIQDEDISGGRHRPRHRRRYGSGSCWSARTRRTAAAATAEGASSKRGSSRGRSIFPRVSALAFVANPARAPARGCKRTFSSGSGSGSIRKQPRMGFGNGGKEAARSAWRAGGAMGLGSPRRQPLVAWWEGGGRHGGRERRRGSSEVVVVEGGTGDTEYYSWTETDSDIEVRVSLPPGTPAKNVQLSVTKTALTLGLKGREGPVLKGKLKGPVQADQSHWTMEEMDDTGEKVLYLCLEKAVDMEALAENSMPGEWVGVLEGEEALNVYYPDKDKDFDVEAYVKKMGYDRERDIDKVDKAMFSDLTAEMKENLQTTLPKTAYTDKDDMIPVMADPKVSPVIDTGVLGLPPPPPREPEVVTDVTVNVNADGTVDGDGGIADAELVRDASWAAGFAPDLGGADADAGSGSGSASGFSYSPAGFKADADFDVPMKEGTGELTERQREVAAGLRKTYEKLIKTGMMSETNPDGTPAKVPDMDEMARSYETEGFMFKDGDFTDEELSKYMDMDMGMGLDADLPDGIDLDDPATRSAFGLD